MRPTYETEEHRKNQEIVLNKLKQISHPQDEYKILPYKNQFDYAVQRNGKIKAIIEIKCRTCSYENMRQYKISYDKLRFAAEFHRNTGIKCYLVIQFTDYLCWYLYEEDDLKLFNLHVLESYAGRTDASDLEIMVSIPKERIKIVERPSSS